MYKNPFVWEMQKPPAIDLIDPYSGFFISGGVETTVSYTPYDRFSSLRDQEEPTDLVLGTLDNVCVIIM